MDTVSEWLTPIRKKASEESYLASAIDAVFELTSNYMKKIKELEVKLDEARNQYDEDNCTIDKLYRNIKWFKEENSKLEAKLKNVSKNRDELIEMLAAKNVMLAETNQTILNLQSTINDSHSGHHDAAEKLKVAVDALKKSRHFFECERDTNGMKVCDEALAQIETK